MKGNESQYDKELFVACMKRFLYARCYNSFEFLATLKVRRCVPYPVEYSFQFQALLF